MNCQPLWAQAELQLLQKAFLGCPSLQRAFPCFILYALSSQIGDYQLRVIKTPYVSVAFYYSTYVVIIPKEKTTNNIRQKEKQAPPALATGPRTPGSWELGRTPRPHGTELGSLPPCAAWTCTCEYILSLQQREPFRIDTGPYSYSSPLLPHTFQLPAQDQV